VTGERGFALVITLIISALLVALATEFIHEVYVETTLNRSFADAQQASLLADSGVAGGTRLLQTNLAGQGYSSLLDQWARPLELPDDKGTLRVEITEEDSKININSLVFPNGTLTNAQPMALRLFTALKVPTDLCDAVIDWTDNNDEPRPGGAETSYYKSLPNPYEAKNAPLETLDELRLIKGFDEKTLEKLSPFVTIYGDVAAGVPSGKVNINTAPVEVLAALEGMTIDLARRVVEYRKTTPIKTGEITKIPGLEGIGIGLQNKVSVKGTVFRILSQARVNETTRIVEAVVTIDGKVLYWREL
jgi:general secretion pathway protein K